MPVPLGTGGVQPDEVRRIFADRRFDRLERTVQRRFAPADEALVGRDAHEQPVAPVDPVLERIDAGDLHVRPGPIPSLPEPPARGVFETFKTGTIRLSAGERSLLEMADLECRICTEPSLLRSAKTTSRCVPLVRFANRRWTGLIARQASDRSRR